MTVVLLIVIAGFGAVLATAGLRHFRRPAADAVDYLRDLDMDAGGIGDYEARLRQPFLTRVVRPMGERGFKAITSLTPSTYLDSVHKKLLLAGLASTVRAEELQEAPRVVLVVAEREERPDGCIDDERRSPEADGALQRPPEGGDDEADDDRAPTDARDERRERRQPVGWV